jgi:predicted NUDIX family NTP pyrophosphohydrolase
MLDAARTAAIIEAKEECGIVIDAPHIELFSLSRCGATIEWDLYYFLVREFEMTGTQDLGEGEYITFDWYTHEDIIELVRT